MNNKLVVILGPTASGKSDLAVELAKKFNGEIISADSRQVYKGLDIGSGKITKKEMQGVSHHLLDVANPKRKFTVVQFQKRAFKKIKEIQKRGKVPFLVGGSGFYISSVVDRIVFSEIKPNAALRAALGKKSVAELFIILKKLNPERAKTIDRKNPRRLIRAIEIAKSAKKPASTTYQHTPFCCDVVFIGIKKPSEELKKAIEKSVEKRLRQGMVEEVKNLNKNGLSWERLEELGLEYRLVAQYLQKKIKTKKDMEEKMKKESWQFAKRQMTWFKRDKRIKWVKNKREAERLVRKFF